MAEKYLYCTRAIKI